MPAFESPSQIDAVVTATGVNDGGRVLMDQPLPLSLARQNLPVPALHRVEVPAVPEIDGASPNVGRWLNAALRDRPCGVVICSSPEQAITLLLLATRGTTGGTGSLEATFDNLDGARTLQQSQCDRSLLTLLFTDIVDSTRAAEQLGDEAWHALLVKHHAIVRAQLVAFQGREVDNAGDGFFATFDRPGRAVRCAEAVRTALEAIGIAVRAGIHAGECQTVDGRVTGVAVHVAARIASIAQPGEVLVSSSLRDLLAGSGLEFSDRDWHTLKGLSGTRQLFALNRDGVAPCRDAKGHRQAVRLSSDAPIRTPRKVRRCAARASDVIRKVDLKFVRATLADR